MSSIRPLATITVLALVGAFLYFKINETEQPLPEGVEDWSANTDIQFDIGGSDPPASPQFGMAPAGTEAPSFSSAPAENVSAPQYSPDASTVPSWTEPPATSTPPAPVAAAPSFVPVVDDQANASPAFPDLPPLPNLPPAPSLAPPVGLVAETNPPSAGVGDVASSELQGTAPSVTSAPTLPQIPEITTPPDTSPVNSAAQAQSSLFSATRLAVQAALDRGELSQALLLLSDWYGDPSLSPSEADEVNTLLSQLAGSVIYSKEPRLEPLYMVPAGERLETIAQKYEVPWQLLAKINGITSADQLQPGQQLKVVRGPFSALIDISQRRMTLMLDRRYAGQFTLNIDPSVTVEEGHWEVSQKLLTPANVGLPGANATNPTEERSLTLSSTNGGASQVAILRGAAAPNSLAEPAGRVLRMNPRDAEDVFDILSLGSKVVIRR